MRPLGHRSSIAIASLCFIGCVTLVPAAASAKTTPGRYTPTFTTTPCNDARLPTDRTHIECGTLHVPENRSRPSGREVALPVAIVRSTAADRKPDPVFYLEGGPGGAGIDNLSRFQANNLAPDHDLIFFDGRGTGNSTPSLKCPELEAAYWDNLAVAENAALEGNRYRKALLACRRRLTTIADLNQYNTPINALDVVDLHSALRLKSWNAFGISYGTTTALELLRIHAAGLRSAVLDSTFPPYGSSAFDAVAAPFARSLATIMRRCEQDSACGGAYPNLETRFHSVIQSLNIHPHDVTFTDGDGIRRHSMFTGNDLVGLLDNTLASTIGVKAFPSAIAKMEHGDFSYIDASLAQSSAVGFDGQDGVYYSVSCADVGSAAIHTTVAAFAKQHPDLIDFATYPYIPATCRDWRVKSVDHQFTKVRTTTVPTLVLGSEFDPLTPPDDGRHVARQLGAHAIFLEYPFGTHGVSVKGPCAQSIINSFINAPAATPDTSCFTQVRNDWHWLILK